MEGGDTSRGKVDFRVGPESLFGQALRRYWTPACLSSELAGPDCDPVRLRLLGQSFVAFRDSAGVVGVLDEACPHRRASLVLGRNEGGGLRCLWHQWKFSVDGKLLDAPNSSDCSLYDRVRARAYPVRESGGIVWAYFGPPEQEPPFHEYGWSVVDADNRAIIAVEIDCSFVKSLEASLDSSHISLLHVDAVRNDPTFRASVIADLTEGEINPNPKSEVFPTDFGFYFGNIRESSVADELVSQVRISAFVIPYIVFVAPAGGAFISVPQDDTHCRLYNLKWLPVLPFKGGLLQRWIDFMGLRPDQLERTGLAVSQPPIGALGQRNVFVQDRQAMRSGDSYSGLPGLSAEDAAMISSIPGISDYQGEHLVASDIGVAKLRQLLWGLTRDIAEGRAPQGIRRTGPSEQINSLAAVIPTTEDWKSLCERAPEKQPHNQE